MVCISRCPWRIDHSWAIPAASVLVCCCQTVIFTIIVHSAMNLQSLTPHQPGVTRLQSDTAWQLLCDTCVKKLCVQTLRLLQGTASTGALQLCHRLCAALLKRHRRRQQTRRHGSHFGCGPVAMR